MKEQIQPKKNTKIDAMLVYAFFFVWSTGIAIIASNVNDILPNHYIAYAFLQTSAYIVSYRAAKYLIANHKIINGSPDIYSSNDISQRNINDACTGIFPQSYWVRNDSINNHNTINSHDPYISPTDIYSSTYTPRDY